MSNQPVELINIIVLGQDLQPKYFALSDEKGKFKIEIQESFVLSRDSFFVQIFQLGAPRQDVVLGKEEFLQDNNTIILNFEGIALEEITIQSNRPSIIQKSDTTIIDPRAYIDSTEVKLKDVLQRLPGVQVSESGIVSYNGRTISHFLIDGDNLLGSNYGMGVKSLPADLVKEVEIIDDYHENHLLKGFKKSDNLAMNITVEDATKQRWSLSGENGLGYGKSKGRMLVENNAIHLGGRTKHLYMLNANNLNKPTISQSFGSEEVNLEVFDELKVYNNKPVWLINSEMINLNIPLDAKYLVNSMSGTANLNQVAKWSQKSKSYIHADFSGLVANMTQRQQRILNDDFSTVFSQIDETLEKNRIFEFGIKNEILPNNRWRFASFHTFSKSKDSDKLDQIFQSVLPRTLNKNLAQQHIINTYLLTYKVSHKTLIQQYGSLGNFKNQTDIKLNDIKIENESETTLTQLSSLNQNTLANFNRLNLGATMFLNHKVQTMVNLQYKQERSHNSVGINPGQILNGGSEREIFQKMQLLTLNAQHSLRWKEKVQFTLFPYLSNYAYKDDRQQHVNAFLWSLQFQMKYRKNRKNSLYLDASKFRSMPQLQMVLPLPLVQDFTSIIYGSTIPEPTTTTFARLSYIYYDAPKSNYVKLSLHQKIEKHALSYIPEISGDFLKLRLVNIRNNQSTLGNFNFSTTSVKLRSKLFVDGMLQFHKGNSPFFGSENAIIKQSIFSIKAGYNNIAKRFTLGQQLGFRRANVLSSNFKNELFGFDIQSEFFLKISTFQLGYKSHIINNNVNTDKNWFYADELVLRQKNVLKNNNLSLQLTWLNPSNRRDYNYTTISEIETSFSGTQSTGQILFLSLIYN